MTVGGSMGTAVSGFLERHVRRKLDQRPLVDEKHLDESAKPTNGSTDTPPYESPRGWPAGRKRALSQRIHIREVERYGQTLPEDSYGRRNREAIATRETWIAARLRAVEQAHRTVIDRDSVLSAPEPAGACRALEHPADREMDLE